MRLVALLLLAAVPVAALAATPATAQTRPSPETTAPETAGPETLGPWILGCALDRMTDRSTCRMLHRDPVAPAAPGLAALALEAERRGPHLVPVVTARDLSLEGAARGLLALTGTVQLRFPPDRLFEMPCGMEGRSLVCAPHEADLPRAAAEFPGAGRALLRVTGLLVPEAQAMAEPVEIRLSDTPAALARFRARQPEAAAPDPAPAPLLDLRAMLSRLMALLGEPLP